MKEYIPQQSENPDEDLFEWGEKNKPQHPELIPESEPSTPIKPEKDDLGWDCPQCELNNGWCERHPRSESVSIPFDHSSLTQEDIESSDRLVDREVEIERMEKALQEPATEEDIENFLKEIKNKLAS